LEGGHESAKDDFEGEQQGTLGTFFTAGRRWTIGRGGSTLEKGVPPGKYGRTKNGRSSVVFTAVQGNNLEQHTKDVGIS